VLVPEDAGTHSPAWTSRVAHHLSSRSQDAYKNKSVDLQLDTQRHSSAVVTFTFASINDRRPPYYKLEPQNLQLLETQSVLQIKTCRAGVGRHDRQCYKCAISRLLKLLLLLQFMVTHCLLLALFLALSPTTVQLLRTTTHRHHLFHT
jgi:hypothetical protein